MKIFHVEFDDDAIAIAHSVEIEENTRIALAHTVTVENSICQDTIEDVHDSALALASWVCTFDAVDLPPWAFPLKIVNIDFDEMIVQMVWENKNPPTAKAKSFTTAIIGVDDEDASEVIKSILERLEEIVVFAQPEQAIAS